MATSNGNDPTTTIVVISDDGRMYKLTKNDWTQGEELKGDAQFIPSQVVASGGFIAFPQPISTGIGIECTIVNLKAVLQSQGKLQTTAPAIGAEPPVRAVKKGGATY
jgi:hypothetical protein